MNYIFITERKNLTFNKVNILGLKNIHYAIAAFNKVDEIYLDIETTSLNPWTGKILLISLYNPLYNWVLVIDLQSIDIAILKELNLDKKLIICHNSQFEYSFLALKEIYIKRTWDTMVTEAKLLQGSNYSTALKHTLERRDIPLPEGMDKNLRIDFTQEDFQLQEQHIIYSAADVLALPALKEKQQQNINTFKLNFFIKSIHNPLSLILAKIKLKGFKLDADKWLENASKIEEECKQLIQKLNNIVMPIVNWQEINADFAKEKEKKDKGIKRSEERIKKLKKTISIQETMGKTHLKSYQTNLNLLKKAETELVNYNLISFDNNIGINWSSSKQVLETFTQLGIDPLPQAKSSTTHLIQPSVSHAARDSWLLENKGHKWEELMQLFHEFKNKLHLVNSFGKNWVEKYLNSITNRVHTSYRQNAATGRLTSGNAKEGLYNSQQIPANNTFRHCFLADEGYSIATIDYAGAELCFMAALAKDDRLIELSKQDMHSYFANKGWKAIYNNRGLDWKEEDIISKSNHKEKRTAYKPMLFGVVYGLRDKKAAQTLNITSKEGGIAIKTITSEIPKTISMVETASKFALSKGYIINNTRTNSRRWFPDILAANKAHREPSFMVKRDTESQARNTKIQSSQADMVMEAIVTVDKWINLYKIDAFIMLTIHDEIVFMFKTELTWFPERARELMERVAAKYMDGFLELKADVDVQPYWTK